jgi:hypothetical protein
MTYQDALKDFSKVQHLTYFEFSEHTSIADLCYLCLHELDLHAEQEYWHTMSDRRALLKFCQKWGPHSTERLDYVAESQRMFDAGRNHKKSDSYIAA